MRGAEVLLSMLASKWRFEAVSIEEADDELERLARLDAQPLPGRAGRGRVYPPLYDWEDRATRLDLRTNIPEPEPMPVFYGPPPPPPPPPVPSPDWLLTPDERLARARGR